jgi:hypothetical protein
MSVGISLAIIGSVAFGGTIAWLAYEAFSAPTIRPWDDFKDRINTVPESYAEALQLVANDRTEGPGRELTVEELCRLHEGLSIPGEK